MRNTHRLSSNRYTENVYKLTIIIYNTLYIILCRVPLLVLCTPTRVTGTPPLPCPPLPSPLCLQPM